MAVDKESRTAKARAKKKNAQQTSQAEAEAVKNAPPKLLTLPLDVRLFRAIDEKILFLFVPLIESFTVVGSVVYLTFKPETIHYVLNLISFVAEHAYVTTGGLLGLTAVAIFMRIKRAAKEHEIEVSVRNKNRDIVHPNSSTPEILTQIDAHGKKTLLSLVPALNIRIFGHVNNIAVYRLGDNADADAAFMQLASYQYSGEYDMDNLINYLLERLHMNQPFTVSLVQEVSRFFPNNAVKQGRGYKSAPITTAASVGEGNDPHPYISSLHAENQVNELVGEYKYPSLEQTRKDVANLRGSQILSEEQKLTITLQNATKLGSLLDKTNSKR